MHATWSLPHLPLHPLHSSNNTIIFVIIRSRIRSRDLLHRRTRQPCLFGGGAKKYTTVGRVWICWVAFGGWAAPMR